MSIFSKRSAKEAKERIGFLSSYRGEADEALKSYRKGRSSAEDVRRELSRHDDYFRYADDKTMKKALEG